MKTGMVTQKGRDNNIRDNIVPRVIKLISPHHSCDKLIHTVHNINTTIYQNFVHTSSLSFVELLISSAYPDDDDNEEDDDEGVDSKFFEEMAKPAFLSSSETSNSDDTSTRETLNVFPNEKQNQNLT